MLVNVVPYDDEWPNRYLAFVARVQPDISEHVERIDHIGSTAVPGIPAKPIIDVQLCVNSLSQAFEHLVPILERHGLEYRPTATEDRLPSWMETDPEEWKKLYLRTSHEIEHPFQIHVRNVTKQNARYALLFRDYLRNDDVARETYGRMKQLLFKYVADRSSASGMGAYLDLKDPFFDFIYYTAEKWAREVDWRF